VVVFRGGRSRFPMFVSIHRICVGELPVTSFLESVTDHPEHG